MKNKFTKSIALYFLLVASISPAYSQDFAWAKHNSGVSIFEEGRAIGLDAMGNVYTAGVFGDSADLDPGAGTFMVYSMGSEDMYVQKLDASGNFVWAFSMGSQTPDQMMDIHVSSSGDVYVTGQMTGTVDFAPGAGTTYLSTTGSDDIFFAKYSSSGSLVFAKRMGGTAGDGGRSITVDMSGNIYLTGYFRTIADLDPDTSTATFTSAGSSDIFIAKYDSLGNYIWAHSIGGANGDIGQSLALTNAGDVLVTGDFYGTTVDFDPGIGTTTLSTNGFSDIFVTSFTSAGVFNWAHNIGGIVNDQGLGIACDVSGNVFVTGYFQGTSVDFDPGAGSAPLTAVAEDIFLLKFDMAGTFGWVKQIGGVNPDMAGDLSIDVSGNLYLTGSFTSVVDFDPGAGTVSLTGLGGADIFVAQYDSTGALGWARSMGASAFDEGGAIYADAAGNVYTTGYFNGTVDFNSDAGTLNFVSLGGKDAYVQKLSDLASVKNTQSPGTTVVYPNPVNDVVNIYLDKPYPSTHLSLFDISGRLIERKVELNKQQLQMNMATFPPGTYFLEIRTLSGNANAKLNKL